MFRQNIIVFFRLKLLTYEIEIGYLNIFHVVLWQIYHEAFFQQRTPSRLV